MERVDKVGMENICLKKNMSRFAKAIDTMCTISPLRDGLGLLGTGQAALDILNNRYKPIFGMDNGTGDILSRLKCPEGIRIKAQPRPITCKEHRVGWVRVKERTSSAGVHVCHWKCDSSNILLNWINTFMADMPFLSGYSPKR